jgi:hypothetical protein
MIGSVPPTHAVFIRSCGERTEALCRQAIERELPAGWALELLRGIHPAHEMYRTMFGRVIGAGYARFFAVDADVVLAPGWARTVSQALAADPARPWFRTVFPVHDLLLDRHLSAGNHLYDGTHAAACLAELEAALADPDPAAARRARLKPEGTMTGRMVAKGLALRYRRIPIGYHGYEQTLAEVYRRFRVRQAREPGFGNGLRVRRMLDPRRQAALKRSGDLDRLVANLSWNDDAQPPLADNDARIAGAVSQRLADLGIAERGPLDRDLDGFLAAIPWSVRLRGALLRCTAVWP